MSDDQERQEVLQGKQRERDRQGKGKETERESDEEEKQKMFEKILLERVRQRREEREREREEYEKQRLEEKQRERDRQRRAERELEEYVRQRERDRQRRETETERESDEEERHKVLQENQREKDRQREEERDRDGELARWLLQKRMQQKKDQYDDCDEENTDPLERCREAGSGRVQLCKVYNVWIDKADLTYIDRWIDAPKEMTRGLLKVLVGRENLKGMCARGRSKNTRAIPKEIINAVEYYVNKKCSSRLKPAEFTNVINMMCATLRHPKNN